MNLPLVQLPARSVYVDDDGNFLNGIRLSVGRSHGRRFFTSQDQALSSLKTEIGYWRFVQQHISSSVTHALENGFGLARKLASSYFNDSRRFHLTSCLLVDYTMPRRSGLDLLRQLGHWPGRKVLLTGTADVEAGFEAFNQGLIQKFIPKSTTNLFKTMNAVSAEMHSSVCEHFGHILASTFKPEQLALLETQAVAAGIKRIVEDLDWIEYVAVSQPFGLLGMAHDGPLQWVQLETQQSLAELAELAEQNGLDQKYVGEIEDGVSLVGFEIAREFDMPGGLDLVEAVDVCNAPLVVAGVLDLDTPVLSRAAYGLDDINSIQDEVRSVLTHALGTYRYFDAISGGGATLEARRPSPSLAVTTAMQSHEAAVQRVAQTATFSEIHVAAVTAGMDQMVMPAELRGQLETAVALQRAGSRDKSEALV
jgi:CheY-like chemotaxis protein